MQEVIHIIQNSIDQLDNAVACYLMEGQSLFCEGNTIAGYNSIAGCPRDIMDT
jgi:hypothetical protein